jgi:hypothetical protein
MAVDFNRDMAERKATEILEKKSRRLDTHHFIGFLLR